MWPFKKTYEELRACLEEEIAGCRARFTVLQKYEDYTIFECARLAEHIARAEIKLKQIPPPSRGMSGE